MQNGIVVVNKCVNKLDVVIRSAILNALILQGIRDETLRWEYGLLRRLMSLSYDIEGNLLKNEKVNFHPGKRLLRNIGGAA